MTEMKHGGGTEERGSVSPETDTDQSPEMIRREFIKRFGVYAAGSAIGLFVLMSAKTSKAGTDSAP